ncbi:hypothetical protein [Luedemannella helvata]|uniref:von Hippel-Lindau disease tumour suppressor beta domain-containing protein n=1 Tax=Luedemannella helvata TaxID=349315 RepID=A0ABN2KC91_9ACTN
MAVDGRDAAPEAADIELSAGGDEMDAAPWRPRHRWTLWVAGAALLLAVVGLSVYRLVLCPAGDRCGRAELSTAGARVAAAAAVTIEAGQARLVPIACAVGPQPPAPATPPPYQDVRLTFYNATAGPVHVLYLWYDPIDGLFRAFEAAELGPGQRTTQPVGSQAYWLVNDAAGGCLAYFAAPPSGHGAAVVVS